MRETLKKFGIPGGGLGGRQGRQTRGGQRLRLGQRRRPSAGDDGLAVLSGERQQGNHQRRHAAAWSKSGKLSLDDRVYPLLGRPQPLDGFQLDPRVKDITRAAVAAPCRRFRSAQRAANMCGWPRRSPSRRGHKLPVSDDLVIRYALSRPLGVPARHGRALLQFRLLLAREVIQRVGGQPYEQYVRQHVLRPAGISDLELERPAPSYAPNEVRRYGRDGLKEFPGGRGPIGPPAGSWIGSAVDLARFLAAVDGSRGKSLLLPASYREMLVAPRAAENPQGRLAFRPGLGRGGARAAAASRFSKNGGVPGIHTYIEHLPDGVDWVVLLNGGEHQEGKPSPLGYCTKRLRKAIEGTVHWPARDLFERHSTSGRLSGTHSASILPLDKAPGAGRRVRLRSGDALRRIHVIPGLTPGAHDLRRTPGAENMDPSPSTARKRPQPLAGQPLPMTADEVRARGWDAVDVVFVSGDAYVDHPSFAMALLGRVLEAEGYRVAILSQPDWHSCGPWRTFGRPRLCFAVSAGNMDSMLNHYTANRKVRNDDAYSPGGQIGRRPDRATLAYCQRAREAYRACR